MSGLYQTWPLVLVRRVGTHQRQASQWARRKKETMRRERMTAEYWEKRSIFCKNLSRGTIWMGGSFNLAILTRRASLRISTEVSDSCRIRDIALVNSSVISKRLDIVLT